MKRRASEAVSRVSPLLKAGWPQQVCACGTSTRQPASRSNFRAAKPTLGRIASTKQVTNTLLDVRARPDMDLGRVSEAWPRRGKEAGEGERHTCTN